MNIRNQLCANSSLSFIKEKILSLISEQNKKIIMIASLAFSCLATCYCIHRYFRAKPLPLNGDQKVVQNGKILLGRFQGNQLINGSITYPNKTKEVGEFQNNQLHGKGTRTFPHGEVEEGSFENGLLEGLGMRSIPRKRQVEIGTFKKGLLEGQGTVLTLTGKKALEEVLKEKFKIDSGISSIIQGEFKNGKLQGMGKITTATAVKKGNFKNGELNGPGTKSYSETVETGEFKDGKLHGLGKVTFQKNIKQEGTFKNGELIEGKKLLNNGILAQGIFKDGKLNGKGAMIYSDKKEEGEFKNYSLHGQGTRIFANKTIEQGLFEMGVLKSSQNLVISPDEKEQDILPNNESPEQEEENSPKKEATPPKATLPKAMSPGKKDDILPIKVSPRLEENPVKKGPTPPKAMPPKKDDKIQSTVGVPSTSIEPKKKSVKRKVQIFISNELKSKTINGKFIMDKYVPLFQKYINENLLKDTDVECLFNDFTSGSSLDSPNVVLLLDCWKEGDSGRPGFSNRVGDFERWKQQFNCKKVLHVYFYEGIPSNADAVLSCPKDYPSQIYEGTEFKAFIPKIDVTKEEINLIGDKTFERLQKVFKYPY